MNPRARVQSQKATVLSKQHGRAFTPHLRLAGPSIGFVFQPLAPSGSASHLSIDTCLLADRMTWTRRPAFCTWPKHQQQDHSPKSAPENHSLESAPESPVLRSHTDRTTVLRVTPRTVLQNTIERFHSGNVTILDTLVQLRLTNTPSGKSRFNPKTRLVLCSNSIYRCVNYAQRSTTLTTVENPSGTPSRRPDNITSYSYVSYVCTGFPNSESAPITIHS